MIELRNVSKTYSMKGVRKQVIRDLSFSFSPHRNTAILGPNGAGKSTLLRLISGAELPDTGDVIRKGRVSWPLGFSGGFNGSMTGLENVRLVARLYGEDTEQLIENVRREAELGPSLNLPVRTYSSGMKARLAFAMSMAINFDCYLVDEVIAVGDESFQRRTRDAFRKKLAKSRIIMVSHSMSKIRQYCDNGLLLSEQAVWYFDDIDELASAYHNVLGRVGCP